MKPFVVNLAIIASLMIIPALIVSNKASAKLKNTYSCGPADDYFSQDSSKADTTGTVKVFENIKALAGDWVGTFKWSGGRSAQGKMDAKYYVTGNGTAVVEDLLMDGKPMMTSVYHLDGSALRMTHYCAAGNQPRLKMSKIDEGQRSVQFDFVDATNMASPDAAHVHGLALQFVDDGHITLIFTFRKAGADSYEQIELARPHS